MEHVIETGQTFRLRLAALGASDHPVLHELAGQGYCDYFAVPVTFGNGVVQAAMFATRDEAGFGDDQVAAVESLATPLAAALEPIAMRRSTASLLAAFLGEGPAARVQAGAVRQGDVVETEAAILLADMRGFTPLSLTLPPDDLLKLLGRYFEVVVNAVRAEGGDVLKFIGDGVLAIFPVLGAERDRRAVCAAAVRAAARAVAAGEETSVPAFVTALHVGPVIYGNVGSASRLDFTVVGPTVNTVSRLELVAKANDERAVCSASFARHLPEGFVSELGVFELKGLEPQAVFAVRRSASRGLDGRAKGPTWRAVSKQRRRSRHGGAADARGDKGAGRPGRRCDLGRHSGTGDHAGGAGRGAGLDRERRGAGERRTPESLRPGRTNRRDPARAGRR